MTIDRNRVRILFVIAGLPAGGAERQLSLLIENIDQSRYEVGLLIFNDETKIYYPMARDTASWFKALGLSSSLSRVRLFFGLFRGINESIDEFKPDIIHSYLNVANHFVRIATALRRRPYKIITSVRVDFDTGYRKREKFLERWLHHLSDRIICNTRQSAEQIRSRFGLDERQVLTIENAVSPGFFEEAKEQGVLSDLPDGCRVALTVARFSHQKNLLEYVRTVKRLEDESALGDWHFAIIGEGTLREELAREIKPVAGRVQLLSPVTDLRPYYGRASVIVIPSLFEGQPNVALEAQAAGKPVAINEPANATGCVRPENGFVLMGELSAELLRVLECDESQLADKGQHAKADMQARYSVGRLTRETQAVYDALMGIATSGS